MGETEVLTVSAEKARENSGVEKHEYDGSDQRG
jgi:hypothetical protein